MIITCIHTYQYNKYNEFANVYSSNYLKYIFFKYIYCILITRLKLLRNRKSTIM